MGVNLSVSVGPTTKLTRNRSSAMLSPYISKRTRSSSYSDPKANPIWSEGSPKLSQGLLHLPGTATSDPDDGLIHPMPLGTISSSEGESVRVLQEAEGGANYSFLEVFLKNQELFPPHSPLLPFPGENFSFIENFSEHCWYETLRVLISQ